ncbi:hypothetical protein FRB98_006134 [Tulasnella sp. 332]|nr:hypothetical protein FRB98_006134 [Tulasnella sp. 332]
MRFSFRSRTVAGGEDKRVKKLPFLSIFGRKFKKTHSENAIAAPSHQGNVSIDQTSSSSSSPNKRVKGDAPSPNLSPCQSPTQFNTQTPVADTPEAYLNFRSPESDLELEDTCYARPSRCPDFYEGDRESEERMKFSMESIPEVEEEEEKEYILAHDRPRFELTHENDSCARLSCRPGFYEDHCESEETPTLNPLNSPTLTSATRMITSTLSVGQVALHELFTIPAASLPSPAAFSFTKTFARPSQIMTFSMESIPEEIEVEEITPRDTPDTTPSSPLTSKSAGTITVLSSSIHSISPRSSCLSELPMLNLETPCADLLYSGDQQETVAWGYEPKGLGLCISSAATSSNDILQPYPLLEPVAEDQPVRSLSPVLASSTSSSDFPRLSLSSSTSPLPSTTFDSSAPFKESTSISPAASVDEQQRSGFLSSELDVSSKNCLKGVDRWSLELETPQERFQSHISATPMEALLGALFPEEYAHLAPTPALSASNWSSADANILYTSPAPTPSSSYLLPELLASSPSMSEADSVNFSEESIDTPSASHSQDHWKSRVSMCDIRELARRENERLERFGPQHSIAEALRLLDIAELSLAVPYRD